MVTFLCARTTPYNSENRQMIRFELWLNLPSYNNLLEAVAALMEVISHCHGHPQPANR